VAAWMSDGNVKSLEQFVSAGFGLSADLSFSGEQVIETNMADQAQTAAAAGAYSASSSRQAQLFALNSRTFQAQGFSREANSVARSLNVTQRDTYRRVSNKLALRFQSDTRFGFSVLNRFNAQTRQVAQQTPDSLQGYLDNTSKLADTGSGNLMTSFFDAVDSYLDGAEDTIIRKVNDFFAMAGQELGFSEDLVNVAKDHMLESVDRFFNRVDEAMSKIAGYFGVTADSDQPTLPAGPATTGDLSPYTAATEEAAELAVA